MADFELVFILGWVLGGIVGFNIHAAITKFLVKDEGEKQCTQVEKT